MSWIVYSTNPNFEDSYESVFDIFSDEIIKNLIDENKSIIGKKVHLTYIITSIENTEYDSWHSTYEDDIEIVDYYIIGNILQHEYDEHNLILKMNYEDTIII